MIARDPADIDTLAADYVLGTLGAQRGEVFLILAHGPDPGSDPAEVEACKELQRRVAWWEQHLAPLALAMTPVEPPPEVWAGIARRIAEPPAKSPERLDDASSASVALLPGSQRETLAIPFWERLAFWRWSAGTAAAACIALLVVVVGRNSLDRVTGIAVLSPTPSAAAAAGAFLLERRGDGLVVTALDARPAPPGQALELWVLPASGPAPLGLVPPSGAVAPAPFALQGLLPGGSAVAISLEPAGGSPTGKPTGPVLFAGRLAEVAR